MESLGAPAQLRERFAAPPEVEVYPENWLAVRLFSLLSTQWRVGMNGPTGLDYAALPAVLDLYGVKKKHRADAFEALRTMECEALRVWAEKRS